MSSRKEEKERLRQERLEREQAASAAAGRRKRMGLVVAGILGLAAVVAIAAVLLAGGDDGAAGGGSKGGGFPKVDVPEPKITDDVDAAAKAAGCTLTKPKNEGAQHVTGKVKYKSNPPTSGSHAPPPDWASDKAYTKAPGTENLVHSLEHGRVIFQWNPSAPARVRGALKAVYDEEPAILIITPNATKMPYEVAATAWDNLLACPKYNDRVPDALRTFRDEFRLQGPEYVPNPQ